MIEINLFDSLFGQTGCSVAYQQPKHVRYVYDQMEWDGITVFTDSHVNEAIVDQVNSPIKVAWLREPRCLWPETYGRFSRQSHRFDLIMNYGYGGHGRRSNRYQFAPYGGTWIDRSDWRVWPKTRNVSMLYGEKNQTAGHRLRHEIAEHLGVTSGVDYYVNGPYPGTQVSYGQQTKYDVHRDYHYSIVVETCRDHNLFTEITLDCLMLGTVPILWGCPNIDEFFDARGIIQFEKATDLDDILWMIGPEDYASRLPAIVDNCREAERYAVTEDWLYDHVWKEFYPHES